MRPLMVALEVQLSFDTDTAQVQKTLLEAVV
jgi:small-conductance mechanosensitive channel